MPTPDADPYASAPDYPDDAEYFVMTVDGTSLATSISAVMSHADGDLDADDVRRQIPDHAERLSNPDSFSFPAGEPIPELFVHEQFWKTNHRRLVALDGDGQPLDDGRPETEAERVARRVAPKIADADPDRDADRSEQSADPTPESPTDGDGEDPLAGLTADDLADMDYSSLRGLASAVEGVDGNASRDEIEAALIDKLREQRDADAPEREGAA